METNEIFYRELQRSRIVAIIRGVDWKYGDQVLQALYDGGITLMEITLNTERAPEMIRRARDLFNGRMIVGAGTVRDAKGLASASEAGAQFIVTPTVDLEVLDLCQKTKLPVLCGAVTPTEIATAFQHGSNFVKIFPAGSLGPQYIREIRGPMPDIPLIAVGGVSEENARQFFDAGVYGLGVGGSLIDKAAILRADYTAIRSKAEALTRIAQTYAGTK